MYNQKIYNSMNQDGYKIRKETPRTGPSSGFERTVRPLNAIGPPPRNFLIKMSVEAILG